jgi:hypothetical protein
MTIAYVQKAPTAGITGGNNTAAGSLDLLFDSSVTAGNCIIVWSYYNRTQNATISDNNGNSYTEIGWTESKTGSYRWMSWICASANAGSTTITVSNSDTSTGDFYAGAVAFSGVGIVHKQESSTVNSLTSPSITTTVAECLVIGFLFGGDGGTAPTAGNIDGSAATILGATTNGGYNPGWEYRILSSTATTTAAFNSASGTCWAQIAAFVGGSRDQEGFRFRNDDGSETTASWKANQDAQVTAATGTPFRVRFLVNATGDPASTAYQLEYRRSTSSNWKKVM